MWTRRRLIQSMGAASALPTGWSMRLARAEEPDIELKLVAGTAAVPVFDGAATPVLRYSGRVVRGRADALIAADSFLGPTLNLRRGERVRVEVDNQLDEPTVVHWHGMLVPEAADGHPRLAVMPGRSTIVEFTVSNPAGTYFYHPHPHGRTGFQVHQGLMSLLIVRDAAEEALGLPEPAFDLPLVIQDRSHDRLNRFIYEGSMMQAMQGQFGNEVLVNGRADAVFKVSRRAWRLRLLNGSNARIYKLAWSDGEPMRVISSGSGLHGREQGVRTVPYVTLAPAERVEIIEDFGRRAEGTELALVSRAFDAGGGMMGGGMMGGGMMGGGMMGNVRQGQALDVARFAIGRGPALRPDAIQLPQIRDEDWTRIGRPQHLVRTALGFNHMQGLLNGRSFGMTAVADEEIVPVGRPVAWRFVNRASMMMAMPHPMHVHGVRFRVLERRGGTGSDLRQGMVDDGYKDTVLLLPGEEVTVGFIAPEPGLFLYHCHNLEHEDGGMMRNVRFVS